MTDGAHKMQTKIIRGEEVRFSSGVVMGPEQIDHPPTCHCGGVALTIAKGKGYCKLHRSEAVAASTANGSKVTGRGRMNFIA